MTDYEDEMAMTCDAARFKMKLNSHKGSISDVDAGELARMAKDEIDEMMEAYAKGDWEKVTVEAGDALNFMLGVVSQAMARYRTRRKTIYPESLQDTIDRLAVEQLAREQEVKVDE